MDILTLVLLAFGSLYALIAAVLFAALTNWAVKDLKYEDGSPAGILPRISYVILGAICVTIWPIFLWKGLKAQELTVR